MYKYLVQQIVRQKVQQKVHNNYVSRLTTLCFTKLVESLYQ